MKKTRLKMLAETIKGIMETKNMTRNDDYLLYGFYLNSCGISKNISYWDLCTKIKSKEIASIESVGRTRRKIQELYPELSADPNAELARKNMIPEYKDFSKVGEI